MRNGHGQSKRMRGRNRKGQNPLTRVYESNGPDVKIRGTASHIAEKYLQLARDAQASGDPISAENYNQHAEHYYRLIAAAQEQMRQNQPQFYRPEGEQRDSRDDYDDDEGDEGAGPQPLAASGEEPFGTGEPQPFLPRDAQPFPGREQAQPAPRGEHGGEPNGGDTRQQLPSFITGGQGAPQQQNGHDNQPDRFPLHRRRRRNRGPRPDMQQGSGGSQPMTGANESPDEDTSPATDD